MLGWAVASVAATVYLPELEDVRDDTSLLGLVPADSESVATQARLAELFEVPVVTHTHVVQRDPDGLSRDVLRRIAESARRTAEGEDPELARVELALPIALSFAALALIDLRQFREFAFAMSVGVRLDAFLVRAFLIPALIALVGEQSWWPRPRRARPADARGVARPAYERSCVSAARRPPPGAPVRRLAARRRRAAPRR